MAIVNWRAFLTQLSRDLLQDDDIRARLPPDVVASGWLGAPGATVAQIRDLEARLGMALPSSYRAFLRTSNGWRFTTPFIFSMWSADEVTGFSVRHQDWIDVYVKPYSAALPMTDEEYLVYGENQSCVRFRVEYLQSAVEISDVGDAAIYLLNPKVVTPDGEWEAWFFANWNPGAVRYPSFEMMMEAEHAMLLLLQRDMR